MKAVTDILEQILKSKRDEIVKRRQSSPLSKLEARALAQEPPRGFATALRRTLAVGAAGVIAEIKKASPSRGVIRSHFQPAAIAKSYADHGASCLSVLTDQEFFQGHVSHLSEARAVMSLPVLRKDFIIDPWQVAETRAIGADCVLLIAAALDHGQMKELADASREYGMDVLIEIHDRHELENALRVRSDLIGINNRSLRTFETHLETTLALVNEVPVDRLLVTESGIHTEDDVTRMRSSGVDIFLVGEALMRAVDPGLKLAQLFSLEA